MPTEGLYIDHVIYGVVDVDTAAERLRRECGLGSVPGGIHLGGTTNLIVPLAPPTFIELLGVGDPTLGDGAWLSRTLGGRDRVLWWALGADDLDETARRRGLPGRWRCLTVPRAHSERPECLSTHSRSSSPMTSMPRPDCAFRRPAFARLATTASPEHSPSSR